jgi:uncharacterized protein (TIGR02246 family)
MDTRTSIAAAFAATLFLAGCEKAKEELKMDRPEAEAPAAAAPAVDLAAEEQAIRNRSAEWMNYANAKDTATIANEIYAPDAITIFDGKVRKGSAEIQAGMEKDMKKSPKALISWSTTGVKVAKSGDLAVETGDLVLDPDGEGRKSPTNGAFVTVWSKIDGKWRAVADSGTENASKDSGE